MKQTVVNEDFEALPGDAKLMCALMDAGVARHSLGFLHRSLAEDGYTTATMLPGIREAIARRKADSPQMFDDFVAPLSHNETIAGVEEWFAARQKARA